MASMQMGGGVKIEGPARPRGSRGVVTRRSILVGGAVGATVLLAGLSGCGGDSGAQGGKPLDVTATIGSVGLWPGQFATPRALDSDGATLWVIDKAARVQLLDAASGEPLVEWKTPRHENGMPVGVTCATLEGKPVTLVADTHESRVLVYERAGDPTAEARIIAEFGRYGTGPGEFIYPTDAVVVSDPAFGTRIYVSEYGGDDRISVFNERFEFQFAFGTFGTGEDPTRVEFNRPQTLAIDEVNRELIVVDSCNHRIGRLTLDGELIAWVGSPETAGRGLGQFKYPYGIAILDDGTALVVENENGRVQRIELTTGRGIETFGRPGRAIGELVSPWAITLVGRTAYVLDAGNNRVQAFRSPREGQKAVDGMAATSGSKHGGTETGAGGGH